MSKNTLEKQDKKPEDLPDVSKEFLEGNEKLCKNITKSRNKKGGPYSKTERQARRNEVYRLHFDYGYSAKKISELMNINRNTINVDIKYWYKIIAKDWKGFDPEMFVVKQIQSLELLKNRLREYLDNSNDISEKLAIEKMILDTESRIVKINLKLCDSIDMVHENSLKWLNDWMKKNDKDTRYISHGDLVRVPAKKHEQINRLLKNW